MSRKTHSKNKRNMIFQEADEIYGEDPNLWREDRHMEEQFINLHMAIVIHHMVKTYII